MPYPAGHRERTKERIVRSARTLFNRHGFTEVSIDEVMVHAGLTRGVFYRYFDAKSDLYAEAIAQAMKDPPVARWPEVSVDFAAVDAAQQVIHAYLSHQHFEDIDGSCPLVALPSDVSRADATVKRSFEKVFEAMVGLFEQSQGAEGGDAHGRALAIAGLCVGGMVIARSLDNRELADSLREAARNIALELGVWTKRSRPRRRGRRRPTEKRE
jgi:TetR/AcrR family transcriptional regulator, transcriptional repressor for nem operon